jgi:predicted dehydrogenase
MYQTKLRWAILGTGDFATSIAIPAMGQCTGANAVGIASRSHNKARETAQRLGLPKYYASYAAAIGDPEIDVIYNTLPNHLHYEWTLRAMQAGKHVLCEKPLALNAADCMGLLEARTRTGVVISEAFMIRHHPQWKRILQIADTSLGKIRSISSTFSFSVENGEDVRLSSMFGGGALNDLGCYLVLISRLLYKSEPTSVISSMRFCDSHAVDCMTSGILTFSQGRSIFSCCINSSFFQRVEIIGEYGQMIVETPFSVEEKDICNIQMKPHDATGGPLIMESFRGINQYRLQVDEFSAAIRAGSPPKTTLEDSLCNVKVMDALRLSASTGKMVKI